MDRKIIRYSIILLFSVFISAISQVLLKKAALKKYDSVIKEYINPFVILAYILFMGTLFLSIFAYQGIPLSMGPILEATSYIYITIFGVQFFNEKMNKKKLEALVLILLGIFILNYSQNSI